MFSGSIYLLVLDPQRFKVLGPATPLGGLCLIGGWVAMAFGRRIPFPRWLGPDCLRSFFTGKYSVMPLVTVCKICGGIYVFAQVPKERNPPLNNLHNFLHGPRFVFEREIKWWVNQEVWVSNSYFCPIIHLQLYTTAVWLTTGEALATHLRTY